MVLIASDEGKMGRSYNLNSLSDQVAHSARVAHDKMAAIQALFAVVDCLRARAASIFQATDLGVFSASSLGNSQHLFHRTDLLFRPFGLAVVGVAPVRVQGDQNAELAALDVDALKPPSSGAALSSRKATRASR